ncbi:MAG: YfcE family phosphodiesterase [Clostridia bacterium]|nr:YfcE family phosphodiesterase [Clostridia bacterium]
MAQPYTVLVLSDSHGNVEAMARAVERFQPHHILHLGDCRRDAGHLSEDYPHIPMTTVAGNCDFAQLDDPEQLIELRGVRILMMHGHTRNVKATGMSAYYAAREMGADVLLYGHTHIPLVDFDGTLYTMNPGAAGDRLRPTCGIITIEDGKASCAVHKI